MEDRYKYIKWNEYFYYDETSPSCLRWKVDRFAGKDYNVRVSIKNSVAGCLDSNGYWKISLNEKPYKGHRIVMILNGFILDKEDYVDHLDGNGSNNLITNLRVVTMSKNNRNTGKYSNNSSGITGVCYQNKNGYDYFVASGYDLQGKQKHTHFRIDKLGVMTAFRDAVACREKFINYLNSQGAEYSERHGK